MATVGNELQGLKIFVSYPRGGLGHTWAEAIQAVLEAQGAEVWRDEESILEGDQDWLQKIEQGLATADALVCVVGQDTEQCLWQQREMLRAVQLGKPIVPLRIANVGLPLYIQEKQPVEVRGDEGETLRALAVALADAARSKEHEPPREPLTMQRQREIAYLEALVYVDYSDREGLWVPLESRERRSNSLARSMPTPRMDTDAVLRAFGMDAEADRQPEEKTYADALDAYRALRNRPVRRLAVLGEPGAGKSFSLERIAVEYAGQALADPRAPVPLLVPLGLWTRENEALEDFIERQLGELGRHFDALRTQRRVVLLLDAINEIPPGQRKLKAAQIQRLARDERFASVVVSCRERDFETDFRLPFDTLLLQPLKPSQILAFIGRYLSRHYGRDAAADAEAYFWQIAGGPTLRGVWDAWQAAGAEGLDAFWTAGDIPCENPNVYGYTSGQQHEIWRRARFDPRNLIRLASNPYLLKVMTQLMISARRVPENRAQLFDGFLKVLHERERKAREVRHDSDRVPGYSAWEEALAVLAETMQRKGGAGDSDDAQMALPLGQAPKAMSRDFIDFSIDASVLRLSGEDLGFTHQLLQEYLASRVLLAASQSPGGSAGDFWPSSSWWERTGWEVVAELAAESLGNDLLAQAELISSSRTDRLAGRGESGSGF